MMSSSARKLWQEKLQFLLGEEAKAAESAQKFKLQHDIAEARAKLCELAADADGQAPDEQRIAPSRLRHSADRLFGREDELSRLDAAWNNPAVHVVTIVAWGGIGKTSLVAQWQAGLAARNYDGADYFDWSFYSQGTRTVWKARVAGGVAGRVGGDCPTQAAHHETITRLHSAAFLEDPRATDGVLAGNPLHAELLEIAGIAGGALALNVVLTSAGGDPLDRTYYQTVKGMVAALGALEPGGDLFIVSACGEGLGSPEFRRAQERLRDLGPTGFVESLLAKSHAAVDEWQTEMQLRAARIRLFGPALSPADQALTGVEAVEALESELRASVAAAPEPRLAVIPAGPYVIPVGPERSCVEDC